MKAELQESSSVGHRKTSANASIATACPGVEYSLMKPAAIGVRVHSGWGALVVVAGQNGAEEIIERRKVVIIDAKKPGVAQPYHYVEEMEFPAAERHLTQCAIDSKRMAREALDHISAELLRRGYSLVGTSILLSSARPLPDLDEILASHALIHTAEGEFFRQAFRHAFESLEAPVIGIRERELDEHAQKAFGKPPLKFARILMAWDASLVRHGRRTKKWLRWRPPLCCPKPVTTRKPDLSKSAAHRPIDQRAKT